MIMILAAAAAAASDCAALQARGGTVEVIAATIVAANADLGLDSRGNYKPVPVSLPFCRVQGTIEGNIGFELWLPTGTGWNGRMLGAGVGGDAGVLNYRDMSLRASEGFATVSTDTGHKISQTRWMADPKARVDYEHRGVHLTAQAAKTLIARYYGQTADKSYWLGCSGGGRQGLKEMQNYPDDYDGIVAGAPGPYMPLISIRMLWSGLIQKQSPAAALTDADWSLYEAAATMACDAADGVADGIVENPLACRFQTKTLACTTGRTAECLSGSKLAMLETIVAPMPDEAGRPMDKGLLPGVRTRPGPPSPLLRAMWADAVYDDPKWTEDSFKPTADLAAVDKAMPELRADKTTIRPFVARGGRAIIYQGWADPSVIAGPTVDYYRALAAASGGVAKLGQNVRLMMVPGMYHCRGGSGADGFGGSTQANVPSDPARDILWATIRWVEQGQAPDHLTAARIARGGLPAITRKLCAFPASARPVLGKDHATAEGFVCASDPLLTGK